MSNPLVPQEESPAFADLRDGIAALLEEARQRAVRSVNALMTATYWEMGRRLVEFEL